PHPQPLWTKQAVNSLRKPSHASPAWLTHHSLTDSQELITGCQLMSRLVEGEGFEPSKAEPSDLQSDPFDRSGTPPNETAYCECFESSSQRAFQGFSRNIGRSFP